MIYKMRKLTLSITTLLITTLSFAQQGPGHQPTHLDKHPRVNQVNKRIDNQEKRVTEERKEGELTKGQAKNDRANLKAINKEKKEMRKSDGGHLTKADQKALNQQLNSNSKNIGK